MAVTTVAIEGATVIPLRGPRLDDHVVLTEGDRIAWVGPARVARIPADARRVDGRGKYVIPGLADMHAHVRTESDLLLYVANGITTIRNMAGAPRHVIWRERITRGEMLGPTLHTVGPITDGDPTMRIGAVSVGPADAEAAVATAARTGYEAIKVYDHMSRPTYDAIVRAARSQGLPVVGHVPFVVGLDVALAACQRSIEHLYGYVEALQPAGSPLREASIEPALARKVLAEGAFRTIRRARIPELAAVTKAAGTWNCPTLMLRRRHLQSLDELLSRPENRYVPSMYVDGWREFKTTYPYDTSLKGLELEVLGLLTKALYDAGCGVLAGTDSSVHFIFQGASLHEELAELVGAGIPPADVLAIASRKAAEFFGEAEEWGTIEAGKCADLVLLDADPTADIANTRRIAGVMVRGRWLSRSDLHEMLEGVAAEAAHPSWQLGPSPWPTADIELVARYELEWAGVRIGAEEVRIERLADDGRLVRSRLRSETYSAQGLETGWDGGMHAELLRLDADGRARTAELESETRDGHERVVMRRDDDAIEVTRETTLLGTTVTRHAVEPSAFLGRSHTAMYALLAARARDLRAGESATYCVFGPGMSPDDQYFTTAFEIERLTDEGASRRYRFVARRRNGVYGGTLTCDAEGRLERIDFGQRHMQLSNVTAAPDAHSRGGVRIRRVR